MEANTCTYDQATPQPWEHQTKSIPETSPAVMNLNSNGTFDASFSSSSPSFTSPRKHSRLSLSRIKREKKLREQALAAGSGSGSGSGSDHSPPPSNIQQDIRVNSNNSSVSNEKEMNGFRGGDDTLQRLGIRIGGDERGRIGIGIERPSRTCSDEGKEEINQSLRGRGFNFDLNDMDDSSSSSDNDGSEAGSDSSSRRQQERLHSSTVMDALIWEQNSSEKSSEEWAHMDGQQRQEIFLNQDDSDSDQDVFKMSTRKRRRRRITICDDDEGDNDEFNCHDPDTSRKMVARRGIFQTSDDLLLSPTRDESDHDSEHNLCLAQQTCTDSGSPLLSPTGTCTRTVAPTSIGETSTIRDGLRTSPFPRHYFSRKSSPQANDDIESSDSDNSEESGEDDLEILPSRKSKSKRMAPAPAPEREVICLDSDDDENENDQQNAQMESHRKSLLPAWGAQISHRQGRPMPSSTSSKKRARPISSSTSTDANANANAIRARTTMVSTLFASARTSSTTSARTSSTTTRSSSIRRISTEAPIRPSDLYSNRRDLTGGSGLGLGGFQVRTEYQSDNGEEEEQAPPPPARRKRAAASTSRRKAAPKTTAKGRKRKARKGGKKNYRARGGNSGGAWSANEQGISNYRSGRNARNARNTNNGEPYMDVKRIDPNLGNAGGASISFE